MNSKSPLNQFVLQSAKQYLQTVVLVDDRIYETREGAVATDLKRPQSSARKPAVKSATKPTSAQSTDPVPDDDVSFHDVQNSFAKERIVCSLYQPKKEASFGKSSDVYGLCSTADVVIVDWDLHGNHGERASELVANLLEESMAEIPHQMRLIQVYTMQSNLGDVANTVYEALTERLGEDVVSVEDDSQGLVLLTENARVVMLAKRINTNLPQYTDFQVPEKKLAARTISEFSKLAPGLIQSVVMRGIAGLRACNRRVLTRFQGIDAAFLAHRTLLLPHDAFTQIVPLLADELHAVLEDTLGDAPIGSGADVERVLKDWCDLRWETHSGMNEFTGKDVAPADFVKDIVTKGRKIEKKYFKSGKNNGYRNLMKSIKERDGDVQWTSDSKCVELANLIAEGDSHNKNRVLASLMSQRIRYDSEPRRIHLGVIVRELSGQRRYLLCLQPVCDSTRLRGRSPFVFSTLKESDDSRKTTHCVLNHRNECIQLLYKPAMASCFLAESPSGMQDWRAELRDDGNYGFSDSSGEQYEWVAELKPAHAQRAAEEFARVLSRVGLTESEWLRLRAKQK